MEKKEKKERTKLTIAKHLGVQEKGHVREDELVKFYLLEEERSHREERVDSKVNDVT